MVTAGGDLRHTVEPVQIMRVIWGNVSYHTMLMMPCQYFINEIISLL